MAIKFGKGDYKALIDTGSGVTLVRKSIVEDINVFSAVRGPSISLTGFGKNLKRTVVSINTDLLINSDTYSSRVHIVPCDCAPKNIAWFQPNGGLCSKKNVSLRDRKEMSRELHMEPQGSSRINLRTITVRLAILTTISYPGKQKRRSVQWE